MLPRLNFLAVAAVALAAAAAVHTATGTGYAPRSPLKLFPQPQHVAASGVPVQLAAGLAVRIVGQFLLACP